MFGANQTISKISFNGILGGLNNALNVVKQVLPLYQKAQPIFKNAKSTINILKNISITDKKENKTKQNLTIVDPNENKRTNINSSPVFFQ